VDLAAAVDVVGTAITSAAVVAAGLWAYVKFARGRTFARSDLSFKKTYDHQDEEELEKEIEKGAGGKER
jgi:hypothetical protein